MDFNEIKRVSSLIEKYHYIANKPTDENNIEIKNNTIYLIDNGQIVMERCLDIEDIRKQLNNTIYQKNVFKGSDAIFNPLEADREDYKFVWKNNYNRIDFPKFLPILLFSLLELGIVPSIIDFCKIYMITYTEAIDKRYFNDNRLKLYKNVFINDRERIGLKITFSDGQEMNNKLIRFKDKYLNYVHGMPINEFTTEHICCRIYKVYGSAVRDVYNALCFKEFGIDTYYNLVDDLSGIDLFLNDIPVFSYTNTGAGQEFREKKIQERHPELNCKIGIKLEKNIYDERVGGVYLINKITIQKIVNLISTDNIKDIITISF